jgi:hypothetical protein
MLREHIVPFNVEFILKEENLDFAVMVGRFSLKSFSKKNLNLNRQLDSSVTLYLEFKSIVTNFFF